MFGRVSSEKLNIRSYPGNTGEIVGSLGKNALIDISGLNGGWYRFNYNNSTAYVFGRYIEKTDNPKNLKGIVTANKLNVRSHPSGAGHILGVINIDALVNIVDDEGDWYEIRFNDQPGFVHKDYVALSDAGEDQKGTVTTNLLNVRKQPSPGGQKLGQLTIDSIVNIVAEVNGWYEIKFDNDTAFVFGKYIRIVEDEGSGRYFYQKPRFREVRLKPDIILDIPSDKEGRRTANTWNNYGNLIKEISNIVDIDVGCAIAVLCVESSGKGFNKNNDNRMVIRFENHQFWRRWGKFNQDKFFEHFAFDDDQSWKKHTFRENVSAEWIKFHGNQRKEWQVLDFARSLDDSAALKSISMGAPQVMGFNHQQAGYQSVQQMFNKLSIDIRYHIFALFDFLDNRMISALQNYDFVRFARFYNGSGQAEHYGEWIKDHYEAFQGFRIN